MATCIECNKQFHACDNCGLADWEWDFCSEKCFDKHNDEVILPRLKKVVSSLDKDTAEALYNLWTMESEYVMNILMKEIHKRYLEERNKK